MIGRVVVTVVALGLFGSAAAQEKPGKSWTDQPATGKNLQSMKSVLLDQQKKCVELRADGSRMVFAFDPTEWETIVDMAVYKDKLYMGACNDPMNHLSADILEYDGKGKGPKKIYSPNSDGTPSEEGIYRLHILGNLLVVPGYDSKAPRSEAKPKPANFYLFDGKAWELRNTIPRATMHTLDMCEYRGKWYASVGDDSTGHGSKGPSIGKIFESSDKGKTWKEAYSTGATSIGRLYEMVVFRDKLYADSHHFLAQFDGKTWKTVAGPSKEANVSRFMVFKDALFANVYGATFVFNGEGLGDVQVQFKGGKDGAFSVIPAADPAKNFRQLPHDFRAFALWDEELYGLERKRGIFKTADGANWESLGGVIPDEEFKEDAPYGPRSVSMAVYQKKLYVGTSRNGKVYVSAYPAQGSFVSGAHEFSPFKKATIAWKGKIPGKTSVRFQIRTGASAEDLAKVEFVGPDGTGNSFFATSGQAVTLAAEARWLQYRVLLASEEGKETPTLESVTVTVE